MRMHLVQGRMRRFKKLVKTDPLASMRRINNREALEGFLVTKPPGSSPLMRGETFSCVGKTFRVRSVGEQHVQQVFRSLIALSSLS